MKEVSDEIFYRSLKDDVYYRDGNSEPPRPDPHRPAPPRAGFTRPVEVAGRLWF
jgi:hypothetical protein